MNEGGPAGGEEHVCDNNTPADRNRPGSMITWLLFVVGGSRWQILLLVVVQALHGASGVFYALCLRNIVDAAVAHRTTAFWREILLVVLLVAAQLLLRAMIRWLTELSKASIENALKRRLLDTLLHRDYLRVSAVHSGEWMNRLTSDTVVVANSCVEIVPGMTGMVVKLISALAMILLLEPRFAAILIPGGLVLVLFTWLFRRKLKRLHKDMQEADGRVRIFLQEHLTSMLMIRSFAAEDQTMDRARERMQEHKDVRMRRNRFSNLCNIGFGAAMNGMYVLGVGWCGYGILRGTITFGTLTAITQLITQIQTPFANITGYLPRYYAMLASAERLREAELLPDDAAAAISGDDSRKEPIDVFPGSPYKRLRKDPLLRESVSAQGEPSSPLSLAEAVSFYQDQLTAFGLRDVSFAYLPAGNVPQSDLQLHQREKMPLVLEHLSLEIRKGEHVAFCGQSGCGKSTTLKLLMCVYRLDEGQRYYLSQDGKEHAMTAAFRRLFAYVPQGNALMSGSIREVVSFADPGAAHDEQRLRRALSIACAEDFVGDLANGIDTILGERGMSLSEGQMQRLAIARAVFSNAPILLLDEVTSALDVETEKRLLENLRGLPDRTVITVTHRPTVLSICDRVLRFEEDGRIIR